MLRPETSANGLERGRYIQKLPRIFWKQDVTSKNFCELFHLARDDVLRLRRSAPLVIWLMVIVARLVNKLRRFCLTAKVCYRVYDSRQLSLLTAQGLPYYFNNDLHFQSISFSLTLWSLPSPSHFASDGQSPGLFWCRAPFWDLWQNFKSCDCYCVSRHMASYMTRGGSVCHVSWSLSSPYILHIIVFNNTSQCLQCTIYMASVEANKGEREKEMFGWVLWDTAFNRRGGQQLNLRLRRSPGSTRSSFC
jgi:hypothetical protein